MVPHLWGAGIGGVSSRPQCQGSAHEKCDKPSLTIKQLISCCCWLFFCFCFCFFEILLPPGAANQYSDWLHLWKKGCATVVTQQLADLRQMLVEEWDAILHQCVSRLATSMRRGCQAVCGCVWLCAVPPQRYRGSRSMFNESVVKLPICGVSSNFNHPIHNANSYWQSMLSVSWQPPLWKPLFLGATMKTFFWLPSISVDLWDILGNIRHHTGGSLEFLSVRRPVWQVNRALGLHKSLNCLQLNVIAGMEEQGQVGRNRAYHGMEPQFLSGK